MTRQKVTRSEGDEVLSSSKSGYNHDQPKFSVIIHNVRSILNVGAIFRTADAVGIEKIYLTGYTPGPDTHADKISKTALGAESVVVWERVIRVGNLIKRLKTEGIEVVALEQTKHSVDYRAYTPQWPLAFLLGSEVGGISRSAIALCEAVVEIPMRGQKESLNVAVAFGIVAYELTKKW